MTFYINLTILSNIKVHYFC